METIDEKVSRCKELLQKLNYFNGNVFLTGKLKGLQILSLDNEGNVTVNIDEEKLHDFWQSYKTYYSMTVDGKALYRVMLSMFGDTEHTDDEILETLPNFDGYIYIGGILDTPLMRLNSVGEIDETFIPDGVKTVTFAHVLSDDRILCVDIDNNLIKYDADGTFDTSFTSNTIIGNVIKITSDEKIIATQVNGDNVKIVRFNIDGTIDETFESLDFIGGSIKCIDFQAGQNGKMLVGGDFTHYGETAITNHLTRLNTNGTIDETFVIFDTETIALKSVELIRSNSTTIITYSIEDVTENKSIISMEVNGTLKVAENNRNGQSVINDILVKTTGDFIVLICTPVNPKLVLMASDGVTTDGEVSYDFAPGECPSKLINQSEEYFIVVGKYTASSFKNIARFYTEDLSLDSVNFDASRNTAAYMTNLTDSEIKTITIS